MASAPMICQAGQAKALWKLPESFSCPAGNHSAEGGLRTQEFLLYKQNYIQYQSKAWKCVKITEKAETFTYFFGDENLKRMKKYAEPVSAEECTTMKKFKRCGTQPMVYQGGIYQTTQPLGWYYPGGGINCCRWKQFKVTNCFMYQSVVYKRHGTTLMESAAGDVSECSYKKGQCVLKDDSFLIWNVNRKSICALLPWKSVKGKSFGTSWLSDDSNLALTFTKRRQTTDCQQKPLLLSDQGIAVKPQPVPLDRLRKRQLDLEDIHMMKKYVTKGGIVSTAQLAASMEALEVKWRQNTNFAFSHALNSVCNFMKTVIELMKTQVLANPTNAVRWLTNQSEIFVRAGGNVIKVYPCQRLPYVSYKFLPMNKSCVAQVPIAFELHNVTHYGYMDPLTNIVHRFSTPIDCNLVRDVPLQIDAVTYLYRSRDGSLIRPRNIPTLKVLQWNVEPVVDMEATIFHEIVIYSWKELQTHISLNDIMGGLSQQRAILHTLGMSEDEEDTEEATRTVVSNIMEKGYFGFLRGLTRNMWQIWTFCVCLYVTICAILVHCCPLGGIPMPLNLPKAIWNLRKLRRASDAESEDAEESAPLATAPPLLRRWSPETDLAVPNRYVSPLTLQRLPMRPLRAISPPEWKTFSASEDHLAEEPRILHSQYPSLPTGSPALGTEVQPFRINGVGPVDEPVIRALIDYIPVKALLDSGAAKSLISARTLRKLRKPVMPTSIQLVSASGHHLQITGTVDVIICVGSKEIKINAVAVADQPEELIIGLDAMKLLGAVSFNFRERLVKTNGESITMDSTEEQWTDAVKRQKFRAKRKPRPRWGIRDNLDPGLDPYVLLDGQHTYLICPRHIHHENCGRWELSKQTMQYDMNGRSLMHNQIDLLSLPLGPRLELTTVAVRKKMRGDLKNLTEPFRVNTVDTVAPDHAREGKVPAQSREVVVTVDIEGMKVQALVDTGSSLTIVPSKVAKMLRNKVKPSPIKAMSMTGHQLTVLGTVESALQIAGSAIQGNLVVTDVSPHDLVLGTDVLSHFGTVQLDFDKRRLTVGEKVVPYDDRDASGGVFLCQQIRIPPKTKAVAMGLCCGLTPDQLAKKAVCCYTPSEKLLQKYEVLACNVLITPHEKLVPIELMNVSASPAYLPERANLGWIEPLEAEEQTMVDAQDESQDLVVKSGKPRTAAEMRGFLSQLHIAPELSASDKRKLCCLIEKYEKLFARGEHELGQTTLVEHMIDTGDARPIRQLPYRTPHSLRPLMSEKIQKMMDNGIIQPSKSNWSSPAILVKKSGSTDMRFCVDNRKLNDVTVKDNYPMKRMEDALDILHGSQYFATLDLQSGYYQIPVKKSDRSKTAFITADGLFEFTKMNFGLCNAPATFQRLMDQVLRGLDLRTCMCYIDDIIIPARTVDDLVTRLELIFKQLLGAGLKMKPSKCRFGMAELKFLGFVVSKEGLKPDPEKIRTILEANPPKDRKELQTFLGFAGWCKRFIKGYAHVAEPLTNLLQKSKQYKWNPAAQTAFDQLKQMYVTPPILVFPNMKAAFVICTDASGWAIGAVLCQLDEEGKEKPISYDSRVLNKAERNYSTVEREMLAVFWAVTKKYKVYVYGNKFTVFTDHKPLLGLWRSPPSDGRLGKWCIRMQDYRPDMNLEYRQGKANVVADYLSRLPEEKFPIIAAIIHSTELGQEQMREMQLADQEFGPIMAFMEKGEQPTDAKRAEKVAKWGDRYEIMDGLLYRRSEKFQKLILALPKPMRERFLIANHDSLQGGHLGVRKTLSKVERKYFWPGYYQDVVAWCRNCLACQTRKNPPRVTKVPMKPIAVGHINQKWAWDICGKLPLSRQGNRYILVCMEYFTKFPELFAIPDTKAERLAKIFVDNIVLRYGCPEVLISDQGLNVHSGMIKEICKMLDIEKLRTSAYHPQSDGMVERFNRTLQHMISMYVNDGHTDWCEFLPFVSFAYRASVHESTRESPFFLMYGYDPRMPLDVAALPSNMAYIDNDEDYKLYVLSSLLRSRRLVEKVIPKAQAKQKKGYDRSAKEHTFLEGDRILVYTPVTKEGRSKKFARYWKGPYRVTEISQNGANLKIEPIGRKRNRESVWIHANRAKLLAPSTGPWPLGPSIQQCDAEKNSDPNEQISVPKAVRDTTNPQQEKVKEVCAECNKRGGAALWVACDSCDKWFHLACVGLTEEPETNEWFCPKCSGEALSPTLKETAINNDSDGSVSSCNDRDDVSDLA